MTTVTDNREHICPSGFTEQIGMTQNIEVLIQIS